MKWTINYGYEMNETSHLQTHLLSTKFNQAIVMPPLKNKDPKGGM